MAINNVPDGFEPHYRKSPFTDPWEPLYSQILPDRVRIGVVLAEAHCNSRGMVHGGFIASMADNSMGLSCGEVMKAEGRAADGLVTINLTTDFMGAAKLGQWLDVDTHYVKIGGSVCFTDCFIRADGDPIARASATFKILKARR